MEQNLASDYAKQLAKGKQYKPLELAKQKIAILIDWYLPGTKAGGPVRSIYSLINLLKPFFECYLITTNTDLGSQMPYADIEPNKLFLKDGVYYYYFSQDTLKPLAMLALIKEIDPSFLYLNSFWSFNFSISLVRFRKRGELKIPVVLAPRGMLGKGALGLKSMKKRVFLFVAQISGLYNSILFHATQAQEESDIKKEFPSGKIKIAPNINNATPLENKSEKKSGHLKLFYLSRIARVKNLDFALKLLKDVPSNYKVEYDLFGNIEDLDYWNECKIIIAELPKNVSVQHKGELRFHEVQQTLGRYNCLLLPTLNENFGHSIVESLMSGCPAVISDQTPWNDIEASGAGYAIDLKNEKKFKEAILAYCEMNQEEFSKTSKRANKYISEKIDLEQTTQQYKELFNA